MPANITLAQFIEKTANGKIFTISFTKRTDGALRVMNCRRNVQKGVKGVGLKFDPAEKNLLVVYDMQKIVVGANGAEDTKGAFRMVNLSDLQSLKMDGKSYNWDNVKQEFVEV